VTRRIAVVLRRPRTGESRLGDCERAALSAALALAGPLEAEVEAIALGGTRDDAALELALRAGCDRATRIDDRGVRRMDYLAVARALAAALGQPPPELVLCGAHGGDGHGGAVGPALARWLELPHLGSVVDARVHGGALEAIRQADGALHRYHVPLPAVLCVASFPGLGLRAGPTTSGSGGPRREGRRSRPALVDPAALELERDELEARARGSGTPTRRNPPRAEILADPAELAGRLLADRLVSAPAAAIPAARAPAAEPMSR
jgi:hypothetical protein